MAAILMLAPVDVVRLSRRNPLQPGEYLVDDFGTLAEGQADVGHFCEDRGPKALHAASKRIVP